MHLQMSPNCAAAQGKPAREHVCTGCRDCRCHSARPPQNFREIVRRQRERARAAREPDVGPSLWFRRDIADARAAQTSSGGEAGGPDDTPGGER